MEVNTSYGVVIASAIVCCILVLRRCCCTSGAKAVVAPATSLHSAYAMKQLLGAAMLIFAFWLQVPYTYKALAENHIVGDDIVGASYIICWLGGATIFGTLVSGPLADYFGHQEVCAMSCLLHMMSSYLFQCTSHCQEIPIFGSLLSGIAIAVLINTIDAWFAHDFLQKGCQPHLLPAAMGRNVLALATVAVLSNMLSSYVVLSLGFNPRFLYQISIPVFLLASVWIGYCCDGELPVHGKQGKGPGKNMPDFSDLLLGSVKSAFSEGPALLAMAVTQFLVEVSAMVVIFVFSYDSQWRSDLNLPLEYAANLALVAVGAAIFQSYFSNGDMQGSLRGLRLSSMCLFMATTIFTASWQHLIGPTWHFFGIQVQLVPIAVLLVHFSVGLYLPASASLRAYLMCPNSKSRASILGWMRVPVLLAISIAVASIMTGKFTSKILPLSPLFALMSMPAVGRLEQVLQTSNIATSLRK